MFLLVEVAETSTDFDRQITLPLYAKAGIPEVWLIDLTAEQIEVFRDPGPTSCHITTTLLKDDIGAPSAFPTLTLPIDAILA